MDTQTLMVLAVGVLVMSPVIEALGPAGNNQAKRQIGTVLSAALGAAVTILESSGLAVDTESLTEFMMAAILAKAGGQAVHDGYWTDKNIPKLTLKRAPTGDV